jgi:hypothetical protein
VAVTVVVAVVMDCGDDSVQVSVVAAAQNFLDDVPAAEPDVVESAQAAFLFDLICSTSTELLHETKSANDIIIPAALRMEHDGTHNFKSFKSIGF